MPTIKSMLDGMEDDLSEIRSDMSSFLTEEDFAEVVVTNFHAEKIDVQNGGQIEMNEGSSIKVTKGQNEATINVVDGQTTHELTFPAKDGELVVDKDVEDATTLNVPDWMYSGLQSNWRVEQVEYMHDNQWQMMLIYDDEYDTYGYATGPEDAKELHFDILSTTVTATRYGYQLGSDDQHILASEAEAEALRNDKLDSASTGISNFSESTTYNVNSVVVYDGKVWVCKAKHNAGAWNAAHFT